MEGTLHGHIINAEGTDECKYSLNFLHSIKTYLPNFKCVQLLYNIICFNVPSQNYFITNVLWFYQNYILVWKHPQVGWM